MQAGPAEVLVIGGGDGGILVELFKHRSVKRAVVVEIDGRVVEVSREHLQSICRSAWDDPRVELHIADGRKYVEESQETFDAIILDLTDPIGPSKLLYTREAYQHLSQRLAGTGVVATHAGGWFHNPKVTGSVVATLRSAFRHVAVFPAHVPSYGMEIAFTYAARNVDVASFPSETFAARYAALSDGAEIRYVTAEFAQHVAFQPALMQEYLRSCDRVSTDERPLEFTDYYDWG
jgi:spermidine synthase